MVDIVETVNLNSLTIGPAISLIADLASVPTAGISAGRLQAVAQNNSIYMWDGITWVNITTSSVTNYTNNVYVSAEIGSDSNSGLNPLSPKATLNGAKALGLNPCTVWILDGQSYAEQLTTPTGQIFNIFGPAATIKASSAGLPLLFPTGSGIYNLASVTNLSLGGTAIELGNGFTDVTINIENVTGTNAFITEASSTGMAKINIGKTTGHLDFLDLPFNVTINTAVASTLSGVTNVRGQIGSELYGFNIPITLNNNAHVYWFDITNGNDSNSGLNINAPKQTPQACYTAASSGDSIVSLFGGVYTGKIIHNESVKFYAPNLTFHAVDAGPSLTISDSGAFECFQIDPPILPGDTIVHTIASVGGTNNAITLDVDRVTASLGQKAFLSTATDAGNYTTAQINIGQLTGDVDFNDNHYSVAIAGLGSLSTPPVIDNSNNITGFIYRTPYNIAGTDPLPSYSSIIYVSQQTGNDSYSGLNIAQPKATIGAAITVAAGLVSNPFVIILDNSVYDEALVVPSSKTINIIGESATIDNSSGSPALSVQGAGYFNIYSINSAGTGIRAIYIESTSFYAVVNTTFVSTNSFGGYATAIEIHASATGYKAIYAGKVTGNLVFNTAGAHVEINQNSGDTISGTSNITGFINQTPYGYPTFSAPNQDDIIYFDASGNDSNSGLNIFEPKLTLAAALTAASAGWAIVCNSGYTLNENVDINKEVQILAPNCIVSPTTGVAVTISSPSYSVFGSINSNDTSAIVASTDSFFTISARGGAAVTSGQLVFNATGTSGAQSGNIDIIGTQGDFNFNNSPFRITVGITGTLPILTNEGKITGEINNVIFPVAGGVIFVSKNGNDSYSGLSPYSTKLTQQGGHDAVSTNGIVRTIDNGTYDEALVCTKSGVIFDAPGASIENTVYVDSPTSVIEDQGGSTFIFKSVSNPNIFEGSGIKNAIGNGHNCYIGSSNCQIHYVDTTSHGAAVNSPSVNISNANTGGVFDFNHSTTYVDIQGDSTDLPSNLFNISGVIGKIGNMSLGLQQNNNGSVLAAYTGALAYSAINGYDFFGIIINAVTVIGITIIVNTAFVGTGNMEFGYAGNANAVMSVPISDLVTRGVNEISTGVTFGSIGLGVPITSGGVPVPLIISYSGTVTAGDASIMLTYQLSVT